MRLNGVCAAGSSLLLVVVLNMAMSCAFAADPTPDYKWSITVYAGQYINNDLQKPDTWLTDAKFYNVDFFSVALSRDIHRFSRYASLQVEGELGKYISHKKESSHWSPAPFEFDGALDFRWRYFPWTKYVRTTFAIGDGLSYITAPMPSEDYAPGKSMQLLNYVMVELTLGIPRLPNWDIVIRLHHRSGIYGLFPGGYKEGSNYVCGGIKYSF